MAKKEKEKTPLTKTNWSQSFTIVGKAKISDYTFKLNEKSNKSDWRYNQMNLRIDCGETYGDIDCELMGGYGEERQNYVYVHGKNEDGSDNFKNTYPIDWDDRYNKDILKDVGDLCFINIGIEKDSKGRTYTEKFLTPYDAIDYIAKYLEDGMVINVRGNMRYTLYNGNLQCHKEVNSIYLSKAEPKDYRATFIQSFLIDKYSIDKSSLDMNKKTVCINAYLLEKFKEFNGYDLTENGKLKSGQFVPLKKQFEYDFSRINPEKLSAAINRYFKVSKDVNQLTFNGKFIESGATVMPTEDDLTEDLKFSVAIGEYTKEEALALCAKNGPKEKRMILTQIYYKSTGDDDNPRDKQQFNGIFTDDDLLLDCLIEKDQEYGEDDQDELPFGMNEPESELEETSDEEEYDLAKILADIK